MLEALLIEHLRLIRRDPRYVFFLITLRRSEIVERNVLL
jgi:hypothetical protein